MWSTITWSVSSHAELYALRGCCKAAPCKAVDPIVYLGNRWFDLNWVIDDLDLYALCIGSYSIWAVHAKINNRIDRFAHTWQHPRSLGWRKDLGKAEREAEHEINREVKDKKEKLQSSVHPSSSWALSNARYPEITMNRYFIPLIKVY